MEYHNYIIKKKSEALVGLKSSDPETISKTIIGMINGIDDFRWLQDKCLELIFHKDFWVAKNAITGLGDIARIYGQLEIEKVKSVLGKIDRADLEGEIENTMEDLKIFLEKPAGR